MEIAIPAIPAGVLVLLNFFAPYATSLVVQPWWPTAAKKWVAIGVALLLGAAVLALAFFGFGVPIPSWPVLLLLGVVVSQTSYDLILKKSADALTAVTTGGDQKSGQ